MLRLNVDVHVDIVYTCFVDMAIDPFKRRLVREVMWWEARLLMHLEWIEILESWLLYMRREVCLESVEGGSLLASMQSAF